TYPIAHAPSALPSSGLLGYSENSAPRLTWAALLEKTARLRFQASCSTRGSTAVSSTVVVSCGNHSTSRLGSAELKLSWYWRVALLRSSASKASNSRPCALAASRASLINQVFWRGS